MPPNAFDFIASIRRGPLSPWLESPFIKELLNPMSVRQDHVFAGTGSPNRGRGDVKQNGRFVQFHFAR